MRINTSRDQRLELDGGAVLSPNFSDSSTDLHAGRRLRSLTVAAAEASPRSVRPFGFTRTQRKGMNSEPMRLPLIATLLVPTLAVAGPKAHQMVESKGAASGPTTKTVSQCGVKILPLSVGNQWTYSMVPSPLPPEDQIKRISPAEPNTIIITVKAIDNKKGADTVITLEEKSTTDLTKDPKKPVLDEAHDHDDHHLQREEVRDLAG